MRTKILILGMICLFIFVCCKSPADPEIEKIINPEPTINSPRINYFTANPSLIAYGESSILSWSVSNTLEVVINQNIGNVPPVGTMEVTPIATLDYMLTAYNETSSISAKVQVTVDPPWTAIEIVGEPKLIYACSDVSQIQQFLEIQMTIKNVSDKLITNFDMILIVYPQEEGSHIFWHRWYAQYNADNLPRNIYPGEERTFSPALISLGKDNDLCERMIAGISEFRFEVRFD